MKRLPDQISNPEQSIDNIDSERCLTRNIVRGCIPLENSDSLFDRMEVDASEKLLKKKLGAVWKVLSEPKYYKFRTLINVSSVFASLISFGSLVNGRLHHQNTSGTQVLVALTFCAVQIANVLASQQAAKNARANLKKSAPQ